MTRQSNKISGSVVAVMMIAVVSLLGVVGCDTTGGLGDYVGYGDPGGGYSGDGQNLVQWPDSTWDTWNTDTGSYYNDQSGEWGSYPE